MAGALYRWLFPRWRPRAELRPRGRASDGESLRIRWWGTAAHAIETRTTTVLIDPYLSRPRLTRLLSPLASDESALDARVPARVDAVLCGHSHFDHLLDAPAIARRTGALLVGSSTTCAFGRAAGLPDAQLRLVPPEGGRFTVGDIDVRYVPSRHGRILFGRVPFAGELLAPSLPERMWRYKMGGAFGILLTGNGTTVYHNGSADLVDAQLEHTRADVLLCGLAGRRATRDYLARLTGALSPSLIVPTHHDAFFAPLDQGVHLLPRIDLDGFVAEAHAHAPRATVVTPDYDEALSVPAGDARGAVLIE